VPDLDDADSFFFGWGQQPQVLETPVFRLFAAMPVQVYGRFFLVENQPKRGSMASQMSVATPPGGGGLLGRLLFGGRRFGSGGAERGACRHAQIPDILQAMGGLNSLQKGGQYNNTYPMSSASNSTGPGCNKCGLCRATHRLRAPLVRHNLTPSLPMKTPR